MQASEELRLQRLLNVLNVGEPTDIPGTLKLAVCVTRFWFRYCEQHYPEETIMVCLQALLLGFMSGRGECDVIVVYALLHSELMFLFPVPSQVQIDFYSTFEIMN